MHIPIRGGMAHCRVMWEDYRSIMRFSAIESAETSPYHQSSIGYSTARFALLRATALMGFYFDLDIILRLAGTRLLKDQQPEVSWRYSLTVILIWARSIYKQSRKTGAGGALLVPTYSLGPFECTT